jgi:hypothetical protein
MSTLGERLVWRDGDVRLSQCALCRHRRLEPRPEGRAACLAFPDGIPAEILANSFDHRLPHPDDGGVRLLPIVGADVFARVTRMPAVRSHPL